jgi:hypothetical protein
LVRLALHRPFPALQAQLDLLELPEPLQLLPLEQRQLALLL